MLPLPIRPDQRNGPSYRSFLEDRGLQTSNPLSSEKGDAHSSSMRAAAAAIHHLSVQSRDLRPRFAGADNMLRNQTFTPRASFELCRRFGYGGEISRAARTSPAGVPPRQPMCFRAKLTDS